MDYLNNLYNSASKTVTQNIQKAAVATTQWANSQDLKGDGLNPIPGLQQAVAKLAPTAIIGTGAAATAVTAGGALMPFMMMFLNSSKAKFVKKYIIDNILNGIRLAYGPAGTVAIDVLSAYLSQVARNYDQGMGWKSLKTNITNWFPTQKFKQWLPEQLHQTVNQVEDHFQQANKRSGGLLTLLRKNRQQKVLTADQYRLLQNHPPSWTTQYLEYKIKKYQQLYDENLNAWSLKTWGNWKNARQMTIQQVRHQMQNTIHDFLKLKGRGRLGRSGGDEIQYQLGQPSKRVKMAQQQQQKNSSWFPGIYNFFSSNQNTQNKQLIHQKPTQKSQQGWFPNLNIPNFFS